MHPFNFKKYERLFFFERLLKRKEWVTCKDQESGWAPLSVILTGGTE